MADQSRTYFQVDNSVIGGMNGTVTTGQQQWGATMKPVPTANYYPYSSGGGEWKVEDKKPTATKTQMRPMTVDIKHVAQIQIPQTVTQQNNWGGSAPTGSWCLLTDHWTGLQANMSGIFQAAKVWQILTAKLCQNDFHQNEKKLFCSNLCFEIWAKFHKQQNFGKKIDIKILPKCIPQNEKYCYAHVCSAFKPNIYTDHYSWWSLKAGSSKNLYTLRLIHFILMGLCKPCLTV